MNGSEVYMKRCSTSQEVKQIHVKNEKRHTVSQLLDCQGNYRAGKAVN